MECEDENQQPILSSIFALDEENQHECPLCEVEFTSLNLLKDHINGNHLLVNSFVEPVVMQSAEESLTVVADNDWETSVRIGSVLLEENGERISTSRTSLSRTKKSDVDKPDYEEFSRCAFICCKEDETESFMINCDYCEEWFHGS